MTTLPNLAGVATADLVESIGGGNFKASYINWSRTLNLLRQHAPGWMPELVPNAAGSILHDAPQGAYLLIRFRHLDGTVTPEVPQAVMDSRNAAIPYAKVTARDITDTHRRGVCMAAAFTFGLAYELWAKVALESGYGEPDEPSVREASRPFANPKIKPTDGVWESMSDEAREYLQGIAIEIVDLIAKQGAPAAHDYLAGLRLDSEEKTALWTRLDSKTRSALKKAHEAANQKEAA